MVIQDIVVTGAALPRTDIAAADGAGGRPVCHCTLRGFQRADLMASAMRPVRPRPNCRPLPQPEAAFSLDAFQYHYGDIAGRLLAVFVVVRPDADHNLPETGLFQPGVAVRARARKRYPAPGARPPGAPQDLVQRGFSGAPPFEATAVRSPSLP